MKIIRSELDGVFVIEPHKVQDSRGYFTETYRQELINDAIGGQINFVQENESYSFKDVFRGFHFQTGNNAQAKLIRVVEGEILDIAVNLQDGSYFAIKLDDISGKQIFIPNNYAHGFLTLSKSAIIQYKCDNYYNKESEAGINVNDPIFRKLSIPPYIILSNKDKTWPLLSEIL